MKREDPLLDFDLIDHFWQRIRELLANLNIPSIEPLSQCFTDKHLATTFTNLVNG